MDDKPHLFISHSSADRAAADAVYAGLEDAFEIFLDVVDLRAGMDWQERIEAAIASCHAAVVLVSPNVVQRPDWVAVEAYSFRMRQQIYDPGFRMVPVLLDGATEADLQKGPLSPARLASIQAPKMTSAAIDIAAILEPLEPVRLEYQAMRPFQEVALSLTAVIEGLGPAARQLLAKEAGLSAIELQGAVNQARWLAAKLLRCDVQKFAAAFKRLNAIAPDPAARIFRIVYPYTWVNADAARHITAAGLSSPPRPALAMNATQPETPAHYVRRASLTYPEWTTLSCDLFGGDGPQPPDIGDLILDDIRTSLAQKLGFRPGKKPTDAAINAELAKAASVEPVFIVLPTWFSELDDDLLQRLRGTFDRVTYLLRTEVPDPDIELKFATVTRLPELDSAEEEAVFLVYRQCMPNGEPPP